MTREPSSNSRPARGAGSFSRPPAESRVGASEALASSLPPAGGVSAKNPLLAAGFEALDLLKIGVVVCDPSGRVLTANQTAEKILDDPDGLERSADGVLVTKLEGPCVLRDAIAQTAAPNSRDRVLAVRRPSGKRPFTLFLRAATGIAEDRAPDEAAVLIMIQDSALPLETAQAELRQLYGLTAAEARLSKLLMEGVALEECCSQLGIRRTTARMHLRNIFAKTGVRRQGELVALLLKSIGLGPRFR